jgi:hypothetical protein
LLYCPWKSHRVYGGQNGADTRSERRLTAKQRSSIKLLQLSFATVMTRGSTCSRYTSYRDNEIHSIPKNNTSGSMSGRVSGYRLHAILLCFYWHLGQCCHIAGCSCAASIVCPRHRFYRHVEFRILFGIMTASLIVDIPYFSNHLDQVKKNRYIATFANNFRPRITPYRTKQETGA